MPETRSIRSYDGCDNNLSHPRWGKAEEALLRVVESDYSNFSDPRTGPNPRRISNLVCREEIPCLNQYRLSDFVWAWTEFLQHGLVLMPCGETTLTSEVPDDDPVLPGGVIALRRSRLSANGVTEAVEQLNAISSYIDASNVYGASEVDAIKLRARDGSGKLKISDDALLPWLNDNRNAFMAGDERINWNAILTALQTVFVREHNRRCEAIARRRPRLRGDDESLYQQARRYVGALLQIVTYEEYLPALLGTNSISTYRGYDEDVDAAVSQPFATAAMRFSHSSLSERIRVENSTRELLLADAFERPDLIVSNGIDPFLAGLARQSMREVNVSLVESARNYFFHRPGQVTSSSAHGKPVLGDLAAINILRAREHGLPAYNSWREAFYLRPAETFADITLDTKLQRKLAEAYGNDVDLVDPWIGGLAEDHVEEASVGELFLAVLKDQFERCRDGDRFWYENDAAFAEELDEMGESLSSFKRRRLSDVIRDNTDIEILHGNVFYAGP